MLQIIYYIVLDLGVNLPLLQAVLEEEQCGESPFQALPCNNKGQAQVPSSLPFIKSRSPSILFPNLLHASPELCQDFIGSTALAASSAHWRHHHEQQYLIGSICVSPELCQDFIGSTALAASPAHWRHHHEQQYLLGSIHVSPEQRQQHLIGSIYKLGCHAACTRHPPSTGTGLLLLLLHNALQGGDYGLHRGLVPSKMEV
eukprot:1158126-Pelagomonas_calceolata.AAC.3